MVPNKKVDGHGFAVAAAIDLFFGSGDAHQAATKAPEPQAMPSAAPKPRSSITAHLAAKVRHEYIAGELYAMTGASDRHGLITLNIAAALRPLVRGGPCQLFVSDMKLRLQIDDQDIFYYPDVLHSCDPGDRAQHLQGRHHPLPLHLACASAYASTQLLPAAPQGSILGSRCTITQSGFTPARTRGLARPH